MSNRLAMATSPTYIWQLEVADDKALEELTKQLTKLFSRRSANVVVSERNFWPAAVDAVQDSCHVFVHSYS